jgi:hypothetical protein
VSAREDLEADLAKAEARLAEAIANLGKVNADLPTLAILAKGEADLSTPKGDLPMLVYHVKATAEVAKLRAGLSKARIHCLTARVALDKLNYAEGRPISYVRKANRDRRHEVGATHAGGHPNRRMSEADRRLARPASPNLSSAKAIAESDGWRNQLIKGAGNGPKPGTTARSSVRLLAWQTMQILALIMAYLQYYFIDVNLQIVHLPVLV